MRRLIDVLTLAFVVGSIALQGAFLTAIAGPAGVEAASLAARQPVPAPASLAHQACSAATGRKC